MSPGQPAPSQDQPEDRNDGRLEAQPEDQPEDQPGALPDHLRPVDDRPVHTEELPPLPTRDRRIPATAWIEAPVRLLHLGDDLQPGDDRQPGDEPNRTGGPVAMYKRRIGDWLLWRAGPATGADARYGAVHAADLTRIVEFRLWADGTGAGQGPDGSAHDRFRTWKESLLADSGRPVRRRPAS